nr:hypothetical protein [Tanacetum cinerariifolium]
MEFESTQNNTTAKLPILKLGNVATKKYHKTLLKQQYENFNASSTESLDSIFNKLQKIISRLAILDVKKSIGANTGAQNMAFMSTPSTNDVNTANPAFEATTISPNVNTPSPQRDLEQIHEDDLEAMDLRRQLSLLSVRAK